MEDMVTYGGRYTSIGSGQLLFDLELIERTENCDDLLATHHMLGGGFKYYFHPYLGKIPNLTNIFQRGWNHQLDMLVVKVTTKAQEVIREEDCY